MRIQLPDKARMSQQSFEFGRKNKYAVLKQAIVKGFDTEPVASQKQDLLVTVPQAEGEHSSETVHAPLAPLLPGMNDHFCIAMRYGTRGPRALNSLASSSKL